VGEQNKNGGMKTLLIWLVAGLWMTLIAYVLWYFFRAKTVQPLTIDDLALTWKVHKQRDRCNASRIHSLIKENDEVVGFRCECGYKFIQKRLITQSPQEQHVSISTIQKQIQKQLVKH
jgi:ribosomal protein L18E